MLVETEMHGAVAVKDRDYWLVDCYALVSVGSKFYLPECLLRNHVILHDVRMSHFF
jgi:hypothetical protein